VPVSADTRAEVAEAEAARLTQPEGLINRLVYDAWLPSSSPVAEVRDLAQACAYLATCCASQQTAVLCCMVHGLPACTTHCQLVKPCR
jgi:hypothetical protein